MVNAPEDVLRAVTADAEIGGVARRVKFGPDLRAAIAPEVGDGIAQEQQINAAFFRFRHETFMLGKPERFARHGNEGGISDDCICVLSV